MGRSVFVRRLVICFVSPLLIGTAAVSIQAQDQQLAGVQVRLLSVKPDSVAQFEAAIGDLSAELEAQGRPFFHIYQRVRGDNLPGYALITQDAYFGEVPAVDIDDSIGDRIRHTLSDSTSLTIQTFEELSIAGESLAPAAPFLRTRVRITSPATDADFVEWQEDMVDVLSGAGLSDLRVGRVVLGGNINTWVRWTYQETMSGPPTGFNADAVPGGIQDMVQEANELIVAQEDYLLRFRDDLSFTAQ